MTNTAPLINAYSQEELYRAALMQEITNLSQLVKQKSLASLPPENSDYIETLCSKVLTRLQKDEFYIKVLNDYISQHYDHTTASIPLLTNKNLQLFQGAKALIENDFIKFLHGNLFENFSIDWSIPTKCGSKCTLGSSKVNFVQVALLTILAELESAKHLSDIKSLKTLGVYQVDNSPAIQTTQLPESFDLNVIPGLEDWFYYYKDQKSPAQGELLMPITGYILGGSRQDSRYSNKELRGEDCSSAVAKWVCADKSFSTMHMKEAYINPSTEDDMCVAVLNSMKPKSSGEIQIGDIYVVRKSDGSGHTGIISDIKNTDDLSHFEIINYTRNMPDTECFGYSDVTLNPNYEYYFFEPINNPEIQIAI